MLKPTQYNLSDYVKAINICSIGKFEKFEHYFKKGSVYVFKLFQKSTDLEPYSVWTIHFGHDKKRMIFPRDFDKAPEHLGVSHEEFLKEIDRL